MEAQHTPSAVFRYSLRAESGYSASGSAKISPEQYGQVMALINGKDDPVATELLAALKPFADAYAAWNGGKACEHFADAVVPADFARAATAFAKATGAK